MAELLFSQLLKAHDITGLFSLRSGGVSPPPFDSLNFGAGLGDQDRNIECNLNRLVIAGQLPCRPHQTAQVHKTNSRRCQGGGYMHSDEADILFTGQSGTPLAIRTADCLPILLADPNSGIIAAVHAGWRGSAAGISKMAVQKMQQSGARPENIIASLGPCIGPCCFNIDEKTASALKDSCQGAEAFVSHAAKITADLREINHLQLRQSGLHDAHIEQIRACTACDANRFFSYRRDGKQAGRHLAVVALPSRT